MIFYWNDATGQHIPQGGFPSITISDWTPIADFGSLYWVVLSIVIVGFMKSIAIAKQLASKHTSIRN